VLAQAKHTFTVSEYYRMADAGILRPDARVELLEGEIIDMSPIGAFHGDLVDRLAEIFMMGSRNRWRVRTQNPLRLSDNSEPQPDLMLIKRLERTYAKRPPYPEDVYLLVEVSDTTLASDIARKIPLYGRAGIPEVWIVDLNDALIEVFREPHFDGYASRTTLRKGDAASPLSLPDVSVDVESVFTQ
jgi:Uma2 family endonuclease